MNHNDDHEQDHLAEARSYDRIGWTLIAILAGGIIGFILGVNL